MRTLRAGAKQVRKLHNDLYPPLRQAASIIGAVRQVLKFHSDSYPPMLSRAAWTGNVLARQSLGADVEVELWYLAQHFLLAWYDWRTLQQRFLKYFGEPERPFPAAWRRLDKDCSVLASRLLRNKDLDGLVSEHWLATWAPAIHPQADAPALREVYHTVVENHRRWFLLRDAEAGRLEPPSEVFEQSLPQGEIWPRCRQIVVRLNQDTLSTCQRLAEVLDRDLKFHLRHYRHANLLVSWLTNGGGEDIGEGASSGPGGLVGAGGYARSFAGSAGYAGSLSGSRRLDGGPDAGSSALLQLLSERIMIPSIESYLSQFQDANLRGTAATVLERLVQAIGEIGYEEFIEDVSSSDFHGGRDSLVGASAINLIPSQIRGPCRSLLLAVSKGDKKALGFPSIMRQVREHLIRCKETLSVIILCDHWNPSMLDEHLGDLRAHHDRGVRFLFLMVGLPGRVVAPVAVDLGLTP
jgi:hypothetical protein